ncbi:MAG: YdcF family protein [Akkermansia sp.]|nr:YdcF family protein [Akkermansia sp.]
MSGFIRKCSTSPRMLKSLLVVRKVLRILICPVLCILLMGVLCVAVAETWTTLSTATSCHDTPQSCESADAVGLVLGCTKYIGKRPNYYFLGRMQAAAELWKSGKVRCIIVSGDNREKYYNEPADMEKSLIELGVPKERIVRDHAGLCTYDSVYRAKHIFGADKLIIVSQPAHVSRAVTIANYLDIPAEGINAPLKPITYSAQFRAWIRERGARVSMVYDLLSGRKPTHMGDKLSLPY